MDGQHASKWLRCRLLLFCVNSTRIVFLPAVHNLSGRVHPGRCFLVLSVDTCFFFLFLPPPEKKVYILGSIWKCFRASDLPSDCLAYPHSVYASDRHGENTCNIYLYCLEDGQENPVLPIFHCRRRLFASVLPPRFHHCDPPPAPRPIHPASDAKHYYSRRTWSHFMESFAYRLRERERWTFNVSSADLYLRTCRS